MTEQSVVDLLMEINSNIKYLVKLVEAQTEETDRRRHNAAQQQKVYGDLLQRIRSHPMLKGNDKAQEIFESLVSEVDR